MAPGLLHFMLLAALLQLLSTTSAATAGDVATGSEKVHVAIYYESLCPFSIRFVANHLVKAYRDGLLDAADLTLVPYGNAVVGSDGTISCQECLLNTVEACAIEAWPDVKVHLGFIYCVSDLVMKNKHREWESCFQKQGLDPKAVTECYKGERGHNLSLEYGRQTHELVPPHQFVPWVVIDGKPLLDNYRNFEAYICKASKGYPLKACQDLGLEADNDVYGRL
ncbi:27k protein [Hordeum vulgare]|nr:27k protein [Hordeum vulgare]